jgi:HD-GYP domain-containing protein (c-di-GMP phosphodiesterase class II)
MGLPFEHGLHSTLFAMRLCEQLGVDSEIRSQTYYGCLLFYVGCTADAEISAELFDDGALLEHFAPVMFGSPTQSTVGIMRALASPAKGAPARAFRVATLLPRAVRGHRNHIVALCEVAQMLTNRLGLPSYVQTLFGQLTERWDGKGEPGGLKGDEVPLSVRIAHVARDAAFQQMLGGTEYAARVIRERGGHAFDPEIACLLAERAAEILVLDESMSAWDETLAREPNDALTLQGDAIDRALSAMGDFADLVSPCLVGHSAGVAELATAAAGRCGLPAADVASLRRAALVHDLGRVAVPAGIWQKPAPLTPDEWERVRLHPYHSERILCHSTFFGALSPTATHHHERLDGTGYHRGASANALAPTMRLLAAADMFHAMTEPRPYREAHSPQVAAKMLASEAQAGRLDPASVSAVVEAAGQRAPYLARPAGLTERECQVVALLARGFQTKQVARSLGISAKTADRHVQNAYAKIGISTRAAAALFAMEHGLTTWGELPIAGGVASS